MSLTYRALGEDDAPFLTELFSSEEYAPIFAEQDTTAEDWRERMPCFVDKVSELILWEERPMGWLMYRLEDTLCQLDLLVFLPDCRRRGFGTAVLSEILHRHPGLTAITLDVQQRNIPALAFYQKHGFVITGEEWQPVGDGEEAYYHMRLTRKETAHPEI